MRLVIIGSRDWEDYAAFAARMNKLTRKLDLTRLEIYSGDQWSGPDQMVHQWVFAQPPGITRRVYHAEWDKRGKAAGPLRNRQMLTEAGPKAVVVAFWNGKSPGTKNCIETARDKGMKVIVVKV